MDSLTCPRCGDEDGHKGLIDKTLFFFCIACNFKCPMKIYRNEFKDIKTN